MFNHSPTILKNRGPGRFQSPKRGEGKKGRSLLALPPKKKGEKILLLLLLPLLLLRSSTAEEGKKGGRVAPLSLLSLGRISSLHWSLGEKGKEERKRGKKEGRGRIRLLLFSLPFLSLKGSSPSSPSDHYRPYRHRGLRKRREE